MRRFALSVVAFVSVTALTSCPTSAAEPVPIDKLTPRWSALVEELRVPGVAVAVVQGGRVLYTGGFGKRDEAKEAPADADTVYYIASSTKSFTAMAIMQLAEEGRVDLDAPVTKYLPRLRLADGKEDSVTIRGLLSHGAGMQGDGLVSMREAYTGNITEDEFYRIMARDVSATGAFVYRNIHFTLLGRIVEAVSGLHWKTFVQQRILDPARMTRTYTSADAMYALDNVATPLVKDGPDSHRRAWSVKTDTMMHAAGGMGSTARDMASWLLLNTGDGLAGGRRILSPGSLAAMRSPHAEAGGAFGPFQRESYGLGWYVGSYEGEPLVHHFGGFEGARAHVSFMPELGVGVAALSNSSSPPGFDIVDAIAADVYNTAMGEPVNDEALARARRIAGMDPKRGWTIPRPERANNPATTGDLALDAGAYTGVYVNKDFGAFEVFVENGLLRGKIGGMPIGFVARGKDEAFVFTSWSSSSRGRFIVGGDRVTGFETSLGGPAPALFEKR